MPKIQGRYLKGLFKADYVVLSLLALGLTDTEVGRITGNSRAATVNRIRRIRTYAGCATTPALIVWAIEGGHIMPLPLEKPMELSEQQRETMELVAQGLSNRELGKKLFITESGAKQRVEALLNSQRAFNRHNLIAMYCSEGYYPEFLTDDRVDSR